MNYFKPITDYYIIPIMNRANGKIMYHGDLLSNYINKTFPILKDLEEERLYLLSKTYVDNKDREEIRKQYIMHCDLIDSVLDYLTLPVHILVRGNGSENYEAATNTLIYDEEKPILGLDYKRVQPYTLMDYYIDNYGEKANNFFNPSLETIRLARLSKEELLRDMDNKKVVYQKKL